MREQMILVHRLLSVAIVSCVSACATPPSRTPVLILGDGRVNTRAEQLQDARDRVITYEIQDDDPGTQSVRVFGDTAIVTARLRIKGTTHGTAFDRRLWFSDVYVRTPSGWRYFFGQASLRLPDNRRTGPT